MEKTLSLGAFEELSENEIMVTEGGVNVVFPYMKPTPSACVDIIAQTVIWGIGGGLSGGAPGAAIGAASGFASSYVSHICNGDTKPSATVIDIGPVTARR